MSPLKKHLLRVILITFLFLSFRSTSFSQDSTNTSLNRECHNKFIISPFNFCDLINPSLQIGYERKISSKYSLQLEYGYITKRSLLGYLFVDIFGFDDTYWYTFSGYKIRGELKRYINKMNIFGTTYLSAEFFYMKNHSHVNDLFLISDTTYQYQVDRPPGANAYQDFFDVDKTKIGVNIKYGFYMDFSDKWYIESYLGLGIAYRNSIHTERDNLNDEFYDKVFSYHNKEGVSWMLNIPYNIKFVYLF